MNIHKERIEIIYSEWKTSGIISPLSILSRIVSLEIINQTMEDREVSDRDFRTIVWKNIKNIINEETKFKDPLDFLH